jgi:flagellar secretion chaperone FliS
MNTYSNRPHTYQEIAVSTASPAKLVVMLYEGSIRFLRQSVNAIQSKDLQRKRESIDRAVAIIHHLQGTLDMEKGRNVAADLDRLYTYITSRILEGSGKLEVAPLEEAIKLLTVLLSGWEGLLKKEQEHAVPTTLLAQAAGGRFEMHV